MVVDGSGGIGGKRDRKRGSKGRERGRQGRRVLETVAAVLPDQFRWTADTNCFSGLNRAVLSLPVPSLLDASRVSLAPVAASAASLLAREDQFSAAVRLAVSLVSPLFASS